MQRLNFKNKLANRKCGKKTEKNVQYQFVEKMGEKKPQRVRMRIGFVLKTYKKEPKPQNYYGIHILLSSFKLFSFNSHFNP